jgi:ribosomal protein S18 acetylase RimI-like enzyme
MSVALFYMSDHLQFRLAVASDADLLLDLMREYYAFDGHGYDREKARAALVPLLENPNFGRVWIILDGATPVGYAVLCFGYSLEWLGRDAFVDEIYLREDYRDRGWGNRTMAFLEDSARELGIRALHLGVVPGNKRALHLYEKVGFQRHDSTFLSKWIDRNDSKPERPDGNRRPG